MLCFPYSQNTLFAASATSPKLKCLATTMVIRKAAFEAAPSSAPIRDGRTYLVAIESHSQLGSSGVREAVEQFAVPLEEVVDQRPRSSALSIQAPSFLKFITNSSFLIFCTSSGAPARTTPARTTASTMGRNRAKAAE
jgi:hypothetical protein